MPELNIYTVELTSDAHVESTTVDGYAERGGANEAFATLRASAGNIYDESGNLLRAQLVSAAGAGLWSSIQRTIMLFDASTKVQEGAQISSVTLDIYPSTITANFGGSLVCCVSDPASNTQIRAVDYLALGDLAISNYVDLSDISSGVWTRFTFNATGRGLISDYVNDDGIIKLGIRTNWDLDNDPPTWASSQTDLVTFGSADGAFDPVLTLGWFWRGT